VTVLRDQKITSAEDNSTLGGDTTLSMIRLRTAVSSPCELDEQSFNAELGAVQSHFHSKRDRHDNRAPKRGIDFFGVWLLLMFKRYDWLAAHVVTLGRARPATAEIVALLRSRTGWTSTTRVRPKTRSPRGATTVPGVRVAGNVIS
jgi:hypothetical protein